MATVLFYEKPGCMNNTRQKLMLAAAGHTVQAKNLLAERWTAQRLRAFFGDLPVPEWFNLSAPRVREGEVDYERVTETEALVLMLADPLLIRRPLMEVDGECRAGFDAIEVDRWIGLSSKIHSASKMLPGDQAVLEGDLETCTRKAMAPCPTPTPP
jgi:nitrogenase-associated protein